MSRRALLYIYLSMAVGEKAFRLGGWMRGLAWFAPVRILRHN